jgi:hypothetical protein
MMKRTIELEFSRLPDKTLIELDNSLSPKTIAAILDSLPINVRINRWGDELYTDAIPGVKVGEESAKAVVRLLDVAYWPEGSALCFFYGPTPLSEKQGEILPYSPVNIIGRIATAPADVQEFLKVVEELHINKKIPIVLR